MTLPENPKSPTQAAGVYSSTGPSEAWAKAVEEGVIAAIASRKSKEKTDLQKEDVYKEYNPEQPRSEHGRWGTTGAGKDVKIGDSLRLTGLVNIGTGANPVYLSPDDKNLKYAGVGPKGEILINRNGSIVSAPKGMGPRISVNEEPSERTTEVSKDASKLEGKLLEAGGNYIAAKHQMETDPDLSRILSEGKFISTKGSMEMLGKDGECHQNAGKLFEERKIDAIAIGYARTPPGPWEDQWHQHTWGMKDGKIVETTRSNVGNRAYYGVTLSSKESAAFAKFTKANPPDTGFSGRARFKG